ncbi:MurR/RpiR family transcriptional regulator [Enterobacteriaceae bacterium H18W14]|uniref:MurR/RpiR family transcriptional regulator n=1 Tax=Dryocola boscaweniae TaxID=2925397 RepID=UPI0022F069A8|nr:MurR/RpiR family transcriptional regulator [Dryocola boscaweniae]MCT4716960.1 MurR/RpiR family transcriptional regulator [Dryocola boscaweniae]
MDIVYQLVQGMSGLPAQESRLARFFLENFAQIPESSMEELAIKAGVSPATLQHFARSIGCDDINDFLGKVRHQQQNNGPRSRPEAVGILGDATWVEPDALQKLAAHAGIGSDILERFSHSIGKESGGDILSQIRARLNDFSQQESRVAQTILDDVGFAASATIDQLATAAGVSPATITRFARAAGCDDIRDLRMKLAQSSSPVTNGTLPEPWQEKLSGVHSSLNSQLNELSPATVARAAQMLKQATATHIFSASGADTPFASLLQYRLLTLGHPANLCQDSALMSITASMLGAGQVLLIFAGHTPENALIAAVHQARRKGAGIIVIAQGECSFTQQNDIVLSLKDNRYGLLFLIDLLCDGLTLKA